LTSTPLAVLAKLSSLTTGSHDHRAFDPCITGASLPGLANRLTTFVHQTITIVVELVTADLFAQTLSNARTFAADVIRRTISVFGAGREPATFFIDQAVTIVVHIVPTKLLTRRDLAPAKSPLTTGITLLNTAFADTHVLSSFASCVTGTSLSSLANRLATFIHQTITVVVELITADLFATGTSNAGAFATKLALTAVCVTLAILATTFVNDSIAIVVFAIIADLFATGRRTVDALAFGTDLTLATVFH
jgi:hypothetical protein